jgi:hypothetical protein
LQNLAADVTYRWSWRPLRFLCRCYRGEGCDRRKSACGRVGSLDLAFGSAQRIASARCVATIKSKSFRAPSAPEPPFSVWPEKRGPKRGHPHLALVVPPAQQVREPGPGFSNGHPARAKRHRHPCRCQLRCLSSPPHRRTGAPGQSSGPSWPALFIRAKATAKAPCDSVILHLEEVLGRTVPDGPLSTQSGQRPSSALLKATRVSPHSCRTRLISSS